MVENPQPTWGVIGPVLSTKLDALAGADDPAKAEAWMAFVAILRAVARENHNVVDPNVMRPLLRAAGVHPQRTGSFYHLAALDGVITRVPGWDKSNDTKSRNQGKPIRIYTYTESPSTARRVAPGAHPKPGTHRSLSGPARVWHETVYAAWQAATHAWEADREVVAIGYPTEMREYEEAHPRPRLRDFMVQLSHGKEPS